MSRPLLALAILIAPQLAHAQLTVRVRAEARIELWVERAPGTVTLRGALRDDVGQPLGDRAVDVRVHPTDVATVHGAPVHDAVARTDAAGLFAATFPLEPGSYRVGAAWEGDDGHPRIETTQPLDLTRAPVRLEVTIADGHLDLDRDEHEVVVHARSEEGGAGLEIELRDELERSLAVATTDSEGRARFTLASERLGPPAAGRLVTRTRGDARRGEAQTEVPVVRYRQPSLTLEIAERRVRVGETIAISGMLSDTSGPMPRRAVGLFAGDEHVETVLTDDAGRFARQLALEPADGASQTVLEARFASDAPWRPPAVSEPIAIAFEGHGSTPWWWLLVPMIACALAIGLISRRGGSIEPRNAVRAARHGITLAAAAPDDPAVRAVGGLVLDADSARPLSGARVVLTDRRGETIEAVCDPEGRFAFADLHGERWQLVAHASGYEPCSTELRLPHRGSWSRATIQLRSLRELALARYRPVAEALAPERKWWAFWTPRELAAKAPAPTDELARLTAIVERAAYSDTVPDEAVVAEIAERAERVARELERE